MFDSAPEYLQIASSIKTEQNKTKRVNIYLNGKKMIKYKRILIPLVSNVVATINDPDEKPLARLREKEKSPSPTSKIE